MCFLFYFQFFLQLLVPLISLYSAQIQLENALFCRQNARLKNRLFCSKYRRQNLSKPILWLKSVNATRTVMISLQIAFRQRLYL